MVEFCDNSIIAQLSVPDMRLCVQYAIESPERLEAVIPRLDFSKISNLSFALPDTDTFIPLKLARESLINGGASCAILHSANEVAVSEFLSNNIGFTDILDTLDYVCKTVDYTKYSLNLQSILQAVNDSAQTAREYISRL
jgi:1-deoxy-D-xylulose-5-phosphate reductoisomerase